MGKILNCCKDASAAILALIGTKQDKIYKCDDTPFNSVTDRVATCSDIPAFATPAETIAGTATDLMVNPADLTAKLANQPAAGACTDREDVVWNGTVLQGAAKHYFDVSVESTYVLWADSIPNPAGSDRLSDVRTRVFVNNSCRAKKILVQYSSKAMVHGTLTPGCFVLGYPELNINSGGFIPIGPYSGHSTFIYCSTGGFTNELGWACGSGSQVINIPANSSVTVELRLRLNFPVLTTGNSADIAEEKGIWTITEGTI